MSTSATNNNIPFEVWQRVASFIPQHFLRDLYSINPVFLQLALDERYREVRFFRHKGEHAIEYIKHLTYVLHSYRRYYFRKRLMYCVIPGAHTSLPVFVV